MKVSALVGERFKETPADCVIPSHILMVRGGYIKQVANGIYTQTNLLRRICRSIEEIIREEMDALGAQEVLFPVALPGSLWEESGRYQSVGSELLRFADRNGSPMVLGMTHEEAAVHLVREYGQSYQRYPFSVYQIQTKFRDEARPRGGLIRVREFTMKDAYSFHTGREDLEDCYRRFHEAYERIYRRVGLPEVVSVASDSGMMGGSLSHEFMYLTPVGEDTVVLCTACNYRANMEAARHLTRNPPVEEEPLTLVETPGASTIEALCGCLGLPPERTLKAVAYQKASGEVVAAFMRGDMEVNETALQNLVGEELHPAVLEEGGPLAAGYMGPHGLWEGCTALFDRSLEGAHNLACGANRPGYHYTGLCIPRDCGEVTYHDLSRVRPGDICPCCGKAALTVSRGVEVGNIFQLGDKYTKAMGMTYLDAEGVARHPVMGCYGIGVGRLAASVCEARHDENGPIWPMAIAPWQVEICCLRADQPAVKEAGERLYRELEEAGIQVLLDDRAVSAGVLFSDADLFGVPVRVVLSPRNLERGQAELAARDKSWQEAVPLDEAAAHILARVREMR